MNLSEEQTTQKEENPLELPPHENGAREMSYKEGFELFLADLESQNDAEAKLQKAIAFMEEALSQGSTPHFKSFWEARHISLELFKQNMAPGFRAEMWAKYSDLSKEAKRLKEILEEQSAFAAEQIEIAIEALEKEIANNGQLLSEMPLLEIPILPRWVEKHFNFYSEKQRELNLLNAEAARVNSLRKELIKTEMRIKQKNRFFQRLSLVGDLVFPRRKELIKEISQRFIEDVDAFIVANFKEEEIQDSLFYLREEIKSLQGMAKFLTLNTHAFTTTRMSLSRCWDQVKEVEKERKKERAQLKTVFKQNYDQLHDQIEALCSTFASGELALNDAHKRLEEIVSSMSQMELGREELIVLREELSKARQPLQDKMREAEAEKQQQIQDRESLRRRNFQQLVEQSEDLINEAVSFEVDELIAKREALLTKISEAPFSKIEKQELERRLKPLRDLVAEKKERSLLALSDDDRQHLQQLKELLQEKRELRQEIKGQLEIFRKAVHGSGLNLEQSMNYNAQMAAEKERLEKINSSIHEIENKIDEIEDAL